MTHYVRPAPAGLFIPDTLLDALEAGIVQFRPVYAADDPAQLLDLAYVSASPVAQRLLGLNGLPPLPFCVLASHNRALFAFWRDTFWSGEVGYYGPGYEAAGTRWRVVAQRVGELLVVSFSAITGAGAEPILPGALARAEQTAQLADQQLVQEREIFRQVLAQTPAAICLLRGPEYRFEYVSRAFGQLFAGRVLEGQPAALGLPEAVHQGFIELLDRVYTTGETFFGNELPMAIAQPDGRPARNYYFNFTYQAYREHGATGGISVFAYDVTEQVLARQQREIGLVQLQTVFERAPVALALLTGPTYRIEVANPVICRFWGREQAEVLGRPLFEVLPEVVDQGFPELLAQVRCTGEPFVAEEQPVVLLRQGQRETSYFQFVYQPLVDAQGLVTAVVIVATDVSARVLHRRQLAQANAELHGINTQLLHTNMDLDNFIYTASHDLKTPIANIESLLLLRKQLPTEVQQAGLVPRVLAMMQGAIERFQLTIAQLTDLSRLQQTRTEPAETIDLTTVVQAVWLDLAPMREATSAQLMVDVAACTRMHFAPQNLRAVVYNLLSNAIKYHHPDRAPLVQLRCRPGSSATVLEVQDNGLGLNPQQQTKLFGLFQRLHAHVEGSGVGLYMVKRIVENAGGTVAVASQPGVGSTFTVTFPAAAPARPT